MIKFDIETRLPSVVRLRNTNRYLVEGWIFGAARIEKIELKLGTKSYAAAETEIFRPDIRKAYRHEDPAGLSPFSGFSIPIVLFPVPGTKKEPVTFCATFEDGELLVQDLGFICQERWERASTVELPSVIKGSGLVVICMATYNPPEDRFQRQIGSIIAQDYPNWICIISDDASREENKRAMRRVLSGDSRFILIENHENLEFYHNFERCLELVPSNADFVALSDQDDVWYPNKLSTCLAKLQGTVQLAYCDMRIVREGGEVLSDSYWLNRRNHYQGKDIDLLALANTVTGAASVFRAGLLAQVLPFPPRYGDVYHDQWIAVIAASRGGIDYVDTPLYDYMQYSENIIGHCDFSNLSLWQFVVKNHYFQHYGTIYRGLSMKQKIGQFVQYAAQWLFSLYSFRYRAGKFISTVVSTALLRQPQPEMAARLKKVTSLSGLLAIRAKVVSQRKSTNCNELSLLFSLIADRSYKMLIPLLRLVLRKKATSSGVATTLPQQGVVDPALVGFKRKFSGRTFVVGTKKPQVNFFLACLDPANFFGGYIGMFNFAKKISDLGYSIRIVLTDQKEINQSDLAKVQSHDPSLKHFLTNVEYSPCFDEEQPLTISLDDLCVATSWWTAHIAHEAAALTNHQKFIFLEQDYEPIFYEHGSFRVLAEMAYQFDFFPFFSTDVLRKFFLEKGIIQPEQPSAYFNNPILRFTVTAEEMASTRQGKKKKLLFYGRPQQHNARNLYQIGCLAIDRVRQLGYLQDEEWDIVAIGAEIGEQVLPSGLVITHIGKFDIQQYKDLLPTYDLGLALMDSPHPSLLPIEMASAGLRVVTNTYGGVKTPTYFTDISHNIVAVSPDYESLALAMIESIPHLGNFERRVAGSKVNWPHDWQEALPDAAIRRAIAAVVGS